MVIGSPCKVVQSQLVSAPKIETGRLVTLSRVKLTVDASPGRSIFTDSTLFRGMRTKPSLCRIQVPSGRLNATAPPPTHAKVNNQTIDLLSNVT